MRGNERGDQVASFKKSLGGADNKHRSYRSQKMMGTDRGQCVIICDQRPILTHLELKPFILPLL